MNKEYYDILLGQDLSVYASYYEPWGYTPLESVAFHLSLIHIFDGGPEIEGQEVEIGGPSVNPVGRKQPSELIATGISGIDLNNTLVSGQKIPFFADPDQMCIRDSLDTVSTVSSVKL